MLAPDIAQLTQSIGANNEANTNGCNGSLEVSRKQAYNRKEVSEIRQDLSFGQDQLGGFRLRRSRCGRLPRYDQALGAGLRDGRANERFAGRQTGKPRDERLRSGLQPGCHHPRPSATARRIVRLLGSTTHSR